MYDAYGLSPVDIDRNFSIIEERFKVIEGHGTFGLDAADKFKVQAFEKYKGITYPNTHTRSFSKKMDAYSNDEKLLMHFF